MQFTLKHEVESDAIVTGKVAAKTAIGRPDASMLDMATTSSIQQMLAPLSMPTGSIRIKVQARP